MIIQNTTDLHKVSQPVKPEDFEQVKSRLLGFMNSTEGKNAAGIASIQLGYPDAAFVYWSTPENDEPYLELVVNPKVLDFYTDQPDKETYNSVEGCLSIPNVKCIVKRRRQLTVQYESDLDENHTSCIFVMYGEDARRFQHEWDHLQGILISDVGILIPKDIGRNDKCPCKSNLKWKQCCGKNVI